MLRDRVHFLLLALRVVERRCGPSRDDAPFHGTVNSALGAAHRQTQGVISLLSTNLQTPSTLLNRGTRTRTSLREVDGLYVASPRS